MRCSGFFRIGVEALSDECLVAVISGRDRADVEEKVKLDSLLLPCSRPSSSTCVCSHSQPQLFEPQQLSRS